MSLTNTNSQLQAQVEQLTTTNLMIQESLNTMQQQIALLAVNIAPHQQQQAPPQLQQQPPQLYSDNGN